MRKILVLSNSSGGLYSFRKELIEELIKNGFQVNISTPRGTKVDQLEELGCIFIETPIDRRGMNPVSDLRLILNYRHTIKKINPDIVLTYTIKPNIYGSIACRWANIPYLNNITGLGSAFLKPSLLSSILIIMYRIAFKESRMVFFQNTNNLEFMQGKRAISGPYKLIPGSGVNLERFKFTPYPDASDAIVFNFVGRVMKDKGIDEYLAVAREIKQKYPTTRFNIIGSVEPSQSHYEKILAEHEREGSITYLGYQEDIVPFLIGSHCIIHPSRGGEGMSNVLLETAATGRCLIASDIPGCREIIDGGINGFTFQAGNAYDLIATVETFLSMPHEKKAEMGKRSREKVEREFDRQIVVDSYFEEIDKILRNYDLSISMN
ncbi:MAG TPA: glycosyltransferase family 4 protein [Syntrophomonadaceae bacterium]|jgi:galacturonosyltransferase|nr:glycosyltransferase family 4 protein [Syntrophomonadaceae bacterium]